MLFWKRRWCCSSTSNYLHLLQSLSTSYSTDVLWTDARDSINTMIMEQPAHFVPPFLFDGKFDQLTILYVIVNLVVCVMIFLSPLTCSLSKELISVFPESSQKRFQESGSLLRQNPWRKEIKSKQQTNNKNNEQIFNNFLLFKTLLKNIQNNKHNIATHQFNKHNLRLLRHQKSTAGQTLWEVATQTKHKSKITTTIGLIIWSVNTTPQAMEKLDWRLTLIASQFFFSFVGLGCGCSVTLSLFKDEKH